MQFVSLANQSVKIIKYNKNIILKYNIEKLKDKVFWFEERECNKDEMKTELSLLNIGPVDTKSDAKIIFK